MRMRKIQKVDANGDPAEAEFNAKITRNDDQTSDDKYIITAEKIMNGNWRDDDSISFLVSDDPSVPEPEGSRVVMKTTPDGKTWLAVPNVSEAIELTNALPGTKQDKLSQQQIDNIAAVPNKADKTYVDSEIKRMFPVGSIHITTVNENPQITFGFGTWATFGMGRTLLGIGSIEENTVNTHGSVGAGSINHTTAQEKGGEVNHQISVAELPSHTHTVPATTALTGWFESQGLKPFSTGEWDSGGMVSGAAGNKGSHTGTNFASKSPRVTINANHNHTPANTGGNAVHNNMQPYITVYMWRRTA